ncbi:MAG: enoyl-CoA hydratase-related protein [Bacteroidota bacterium]
MEMNYNYTAEQVAQIGETTFVHLQVREAEHVLHLRLDRAEKKNALNPTLLKELAFALNYAHYTDAVRLVVIGAEGNVFCAGADLKAFLGGGTAESTVPEPAGEVLPGELFRTLHKPSLVRVEGDVYAGGFLFLANATYVIAREGIRLALPETRRGLFPFQVMASLMEVMPPRRVLDWCIRGNDLALADALAYGLVTQVVSAAEMDGAVETLVREITANSPVAIRLGLEAWDELRRLPAAEHHTYLRSMLFRAFQSPDAREGIAAFKEKRKPKWPEEISDG